MEKPAAYKLLILYALAVCQSYFVKTEESCSVLTSCDDCIATAGCIWCSNLSYPSTSSQCFEDTNNLSLNTCSDSLENPMNEVDYVDRVLNNTNQVSLESIDLLLKVGNPESFNVLVKGAEDFPLDLYLLMDFSGSFRNDLLTVQSIAPELFTSLFNVSTQFRVGFGAFVDKPVPPYASVTQIGNGEDELNCGTSLVPLTCSP